MLFRQQREQRGGALIGMNSSQDIDGQTAGVNFESPEPETRSGIC
jgi:hypothetical protein